MNNSAEGKKLAILILAYADYESLELALATHAKYSMHRGIPIYILQNGRGTYDTERTYAVAKRYYALFPEVVHVVDWLKPGKPYVSIDTLLKSPEFAQYDYVIKLDDDVMVLTEDWIDKLWDCYLQAEHTYGDQLAYVTSLVNNNPFGFKTLVERTPELSEEYFSKVARVHLVGNKEKDSYNPFRLYPKDQIYGGGFGTVWRLSYLARWVHRKTTLQPDYYRSLVADWDRVELNNADRYSINCMLFRKELWQTVADGGLDDEHLLHKYCLLNNKKIIADLSIPMIHLAFNVQREENRDLVPVIRAFYTNYLGLEFPISMCENREIEIENRLRYIEERLRVGERVKKGLKRRLGKVYKAAKKQLGK